MESAVKSAIVGHHPKEAALTVDVWQNDFLYPSISAELGTRRDAL